MTPEEFSKSLADAESRIVGEGMKGIDKSTWHCTTCGANGVGISGLIAHYHAEPKEGARV